MNQSKHFRKAFSLVEILMATAVLVAITMVTVTYVRQPRNKVSYHSCELHRQQLQLRVDEYFRTYGRYPSRDLRELTTRSFILPSCPVDARSYRLDPISGQVQKHEHN